MMMILFFLEYSDSKLLNKLDEIEQEKDGITDYNEYLIVWKKYLKFD